MKYQIVQVATGSSFLVNCPIQLVKKMVVKESGNDIYYLSVKYFSMAEKEVDKICLKLSVKGVRLTTSTYIFKPSSESGLMQNEKPYPFHMGRYKDVELLVTKIIFKDGSAWEVDKKPVITEVPEKIDIANFEKYRDQIDEKFTHIKEVKYAYSENEYLWRCPCGCVNQDEKCFKCGSYKLDTKNFFNAERLERQHGWLQEKHACTKGKQEELEILAESKRLSDIFDSVIYKTRSESPSEVASAIITIESIYNEEHFYKRKQADFLLKRAYARFDDKRNKLVEFRRILASRYAVLAEETRVRNAKTKRRNRITKIVSITVATLAVLAISTNYLFSEILLPQWKYNSGISSFESQKYDDAIQSFEELGDYKDSEFMVIESMYQKAVAYINAGNYSDSREIFLALDGYELSEEYLVTCDIMEGDYYMSQGRYEEALDMYELVADEDGIAIKQDECQYRLAMIAYVGGDEDLALEKFMLTNDYGNSEAYIVAIIKSKAETYYQAGNYTEVIQLLEFRTDDFVEQYMSVVVPIYETYARSLYDSGDYLNAKTAYLVLANSTQWLGDSASNRVVAYPVFCDARLYANNYEEVAKVFDLSYESYNIVEQVSGYMAQFLADGKWVGYSISSDVQSDRYMTVDETGYAEISLQNNISGEGYLSYYDGYIYIDGEKLVEMRVTSYSSIVFVTGKSSTDEYIYARTGA